MHIFFYLQNIRFPFHCVWQNIWFAVPHFESIMGDNWGAGLSHNLHILKHILSTAHRMANSLNFGTNTFSSKWPWFCLSAYLIYLKMGGCLNYDSFVINVSVIIGRVDKWQLKLTGCHKIYSFFCKLPLFSLFKALFSCLIHLASIRTRFSSFS